MSCGPVKHGGGVCDSDPAVCLLPLRDIGLSAPQLDRCAMGGRPNHGAESGGVVSCSAFDLARVEEPLNTTPRHRSRVAVK